MSGHHARNERILCDGKYFQIGVLAICRLVFF